MDTLHGQARSRLAPVDLSRALSRIHGAPVRVRVTSTQEVAALAILLSTVETPDPTCTNGKPMCRGCIRDGGCLLREDTP